jgi:hypothetical protein
VSPRTATIGALVLGALAVVVATVAGSSANGLETLVHPPSLIRAGLVGASAVAAVAIFARGLGRLSAGTSDVPGLVRGVRLIFLAVAAGAAGAGWLVGEPILLIVALVIAGVDVVETSFLLLVVASGGGRSQD